MSYQWLEMRITEERDRRARLAELHRRLPLAFEELHRALAGCIAAYREAFGADAAQIQVDGLKVRVAVCEEQEGEWREIKSVGIAALPSIPGFHVERGAAPYLIEIGLLPGDKFSYRDCEENQYLTMEEVTRRILDRALFPKLGA